MTAGQCVVDHLRSDVDEWAEGLAGQLAPALPGHPTAAKVERVLRREAQKLKANRVSEKFWNLAQPTFDKPFVGVTLESRR